MCNLFELTKKSTRHIWLAIYIAIIAGIIAALVKSGFETIIPPRSPSTMPPPEVLLQDLGFNVKTMVYYWIDNPVNWGGNGVHILFSVVMALTYCVLAEFFVKIKMLHGIVFGVGVSILAHGLVVPLLGLSGWLWLAGPEALISEFVGTAFWMWTIETIRENLRSYFIHKCATHS